MYTLINHLSQGNINATSEKYIANLIAQNFAQLTSIKTTPIKEKNILKFTSDNTESYNQPFTLTEL